MASTTATKKEIIDFLWDWAEAHGDWGKLLMSKIVSTESSLAPAERQEVFNYFLQSIKQHTGLPGKYSNYGSTGCDGGPSGLAVNPNGGGVAYAQALLAQIRTTTDELEKQTLFNLAVNNFVLGGDVQDPINMLEGLNTADAHKILVPAYINQGNYTNAAKTLAQIPTDGIGNSDYHKLYGTLLTIAQDNRTVFQITSAEEQNIRSVAASGSNISVNAQAVLRVAKGDVYNQTPWPMRDNSRGGQFEEETKDNVAGLNMANEPYLGNNVPNPFTNTTVIKTYLPENAGKGFIEVYNILGAVVKMIPVQQGENTVELELGHLGLGMYYYSLIIDGNKVATKKMTLVQ